MEEYELEEYYFLEQLKALDDMNQMSQEQIDSILNL